MDPNWPIMPQSASMFLLGPNSPYVPPMGLMGPNIPYRPYFPIYTPNGPYGPQWPLMGPTSLMVPNGQLKDCNISYGPPIALMGKISNMGSQWAQISHMGPQWAKCILWTSNKYTPYGPQYPLWALLLFSQSWNEFLSFLFFVDFGFLLQILII